MVALSLTVVLALITLTPAAGAALMFVLGLSGYATRRLTRTVAVLAGIIPAIGALSLAPELGFGEPIAFRPFGLSSKFGAWLIPTYRIDALADYAAIGIVLLAMPVLLWLSFALRSAPQGAAKSDLDAQATVDENGSHAETAGASGETGTDLDASTTQAADGTRLAVPTGENGGSEGTISQAEDSSEDELAAESEIFEPEAQAQGGWRSWIGMAAMEDARVVRGVALSLVLVAVALTGVFADSVVLLGIAWVAAAALAWGLGEVASDAESGLDVRSLVICAVGPLLWLGTLLFAATAAQAPGLIELTGHTALSSFEVVLVALAVALAAGAYPALAWLRRRAMLSTPAGIAALALVSLPGTLYVAARTYAAASDSSNLWPRIGPASTASGGPPPITAGLAFVLLGAGTVAIAGLLALGQRGGRPLVALLAAAQVGWGLVAVGVGGAQGMLGLVLLLPATLLGLGAMIASLVAGGALTEDVEPDADGPRPVGERLRSVTLAAWAVGAASLVGMPLLPGFAPRQLITQGALLSSGLNVPLGALCWAGDALLALAILRATAPALVRLKVDTGPAWVDTRDIPGAVGVALLVVLGAFPGLTLALFGANAAQSLLSPASIDGAAQASALGFSGPIGQWLSGIAWLTLLAGVAVVLILQPGATRRAAPMFVSGRDEEAEAAGSTASEATPDHEAEAEGSTAGELALDQAVGALSDPADAWGTLARAFTSPVLLPGDRWLLVGLDDEDYDEGETLESEEADETAQEDQAEEMPVSARSDEVTRGDE